MNSGTVAKLLDIRCRTLHRWTALYADFLQGGALPPKGEPRLFSEHDVRVMTFVSQKRQAGTAHDEIRDALAEASRDHWQALPPLPDGWQPVASSLAVYTSRVAELEEQQLLQEKVIEQQRSMLQVAAVALQQSNEHLARAEQRARSLKLRRNVYRLLLLVATLIYWGAVLFVLLR